MTLDDIVAKVTDPYDRQARLGSWITRGQAMESSSIYFSGKTSHTDFAGMRLASNHLPLLSR
jgi:hypothetical protein